MKSLINKLKNLGFRLGKNAAIWLFDHNVTWPFVQAYALALRPVLPRDGSMPRGEYALLALNERRFPGDLEALAETGRFRVFRLPFEWQGRMLRLAWEDSTDFSDYFSREKSEKTGALQKRLRGYLKKLIAPLFKKLRIDGVLGVTPYYRQDYDWGAAASELGYPYIILNKESLVGSVQSRRDEAARYSKMEPFSGAHIIVHNENMRKVFLASQGYITAEKLSALGCIRMDQFLRKIREWKPVSGTPKQVILFSFHYCADLSIDDYFNREVGYVKFFENVHASFARAAQKHPDVQFIIKTKWGSKWFEEVNYVLRKNGIDPESVPNLRITDAKNVHELMFASTVVVSYASTTILEAAVAGKPVIIPFFDEPREPKYHDNITLLEHFQAFDIAESPEGLERLISERLANPSVPADLLKKRQDIFDGNVSPLSADAVERYSKVIIKEIESARARRGEKH
ncbi:MAG: hypothetical protein A2X49_05535 [Lentisphaerae bacterium GWF2_52_8]|nr:MAG: hypothetical protein A2X49_05535 [Lentisphaerae bacterium GWF2_52_8]